MNESVVHLDTDWPEGKLVPIAKQDTVRTDDPTTMQELKLGQWCLDKSDKRGGLHDHTIEQRAAGEDPARSVGR